MKVNGETVSVPAAWREASLLTFLRDHLGLTGTKFGCGGGFCGACTVHLDGQAAFSCLVPVSAVDGHSIVTIEGLGSSDSLDPVQEAWKESPLTGRVHFSLLGTAGTLVPARVA